MKESKIVFCDYCNEVIDAPHGNQRYHHECEYERRKDRSIKQYAKIKLLGDPYWRNEKILREQFYGSGEHAEIDPGFLEKAGFDFDLYISEKKIKGQLLFYMHNFGFKFLQNKKVVIWKL